MARKTTTNGKGTTGKATGGSSRRTSRARTTAKAPTETEATETPTPKTDVSETGEPKAKTDPPEVEDAVVVDETAPTPDDGAKPADASGDGSDLPAPVPGGPDPVAEGADAAKADTAIPVAADAHPALAAPDTPDAPGGTASTETAALRTDVEEDANVRDDATSTVPKVGAAAAAGAAGAADTSERTPPPERVTERVVERRGPGFVPLVLGGVVAGGIGWLAGTQLPTDDAEVAAVDDARVVALEGDLAALRADLEAVPTPEGPTVNLAPLTERQDALATELEEVRAALDAVPAEVPTVDLSPLEERIATLEADPTAAASIDAAAAVDLAALTERVDGLVADLPPTDALAGLPGAVDDLRARLDALPALPEGLDGLPGRIDEVASDLDALSSDLAALQQTVDGLREEAMANAAAAEASAAEALRDRLALAVRTGEPYAEPLEELGADAPDALAAFAETGVPSVAALQDQWDDAARAALRAARNADPGEGGALALLRAQLGARALTPRAGDDPEAVLSRATASVASGDIDAALTEIEALPEAAADELDGWTSQARARASALAALDEIAPATNQEGE